MRGEVQPLHDIDIENRDEAADEAGTAVVPATAVRSAHNDVDRLAKHGARLLRERPRHLAQQAREEEGREVRSQHVRHGTHDVKQRIAGNGGVGDGRARRPALP